MLKLTMHLLLVWIEASDFFLLYRTADGKHYRNFIPQFPNLYNFRNFHSRNQPHRSRSPALAPALAYRTWADVLLLLDRLVLQPAATEAHRAFTHAWHNTRARCTTSYCSCWSIPSTKQHTHACYSTSPYCSTTYSSLVSSNFLRQLRHLYTPCETWHLYTSRETRCEDLSHTVFVHHVTSRIQVRHSVSLTV